MMYPIRKGDSHVQYKPYAQTIRDLSQRHKKIVMPHPICRVNVDVYTAIRDSAQQQKKSNTPVNTWSPPTTASSIEFYYDGLGQVP